MKKSVIVIIVLGLTATAGFLGFWYYRDQVFSKEILKLEILSRQNIGVGDEVTYTVKYKNNGNFVLEKPKLIFNLPENSLTEDGKIRLTQDLKDIYPGQEDFVVFKARLLGKEDDLKVAYAWLSYTPRNLSARYESDTTFTTKIDTVPIVLDLELPSKAKSGEEITYAINYASSIDYPLENLSVKVDNVDGFKSISSSPVSLDNTEWKLPVLQKGQNGKISIHGLVAPDAPANLPFSVHLGMWIDGNFVIIKDASQHIEIVDTLQDSSQIAIEKPSAHLLVSQKGYHANKDESFQNSGPIPPKVDTPTTYTIVWQLSTDTNNVKDAKVAALLPQNVTLTAVLPESQISNVSLDASTRKLEWLVPSVPVNPAQDNPTPSVYFQVTLTPTAAQEGNFATIIGQAIVSGQDEVTQKIVSSKAPAVGTDLPDDSGNSGGGIVSARVSE